jgi:hypothetical protein
MPISSVQQRLRKLESSGIFTPAREYPPFSICEVYAIGQRIVKNDSFAIDEVRRLEKHSPVIGREEIITAYGGQLVMKRYLGVDLADM